MRTKPWRRTLSFYPYTVQLQTRFTDMDTERHVNNVAAQSLHAEARTQWHMAHFGAREWLAQAAQVRMAAIATDFVQVTFYPAPVTCGISLIDLTEHNYTLAVGLFQHGVCVGLHSCRMGSWRDGAWSTLPAALFDSLKNMGVRSDSADDVETA